MLELVRNGSLLEHIYRNTYAFSEYNEYLGALVKQLTHRFPRMEIFEIGDFHIGFQFRAISTDLILGAGTGSTTEAVLNAIQDQYSSYTYTDISASFFSQAQSTFSQHSSRILYKVFDVTKEPSKQNALERAYDLVIASNVLHATPNLEQTLTNVRKLLKPGGYLVMLEVTDIEPLRPTFFFGCLPDWWVGEADGRPHHPLLPTESWGEIFRKTGFSGLDSSTPKHNVFMAPFSVMLTQAVDNQIEIIRQPLVTTNKIIIDNLLILGGSTLHSYGIIADIKLKLDPFVKATTTVETLESLKQEHFSPKQVVLSLLELDDPVFEPFTPQRFMALQLLAERSRNVVWVVQGGSGDQPYSNMMVGVSRCLVGEQPEMLFQIVDFDVQENICTSYIAESLLRMVISDGWKGSVEPYCPVWALEREVRYQKGDVYIPRYVPNDKRNLQYNSWRRAIREKVSHEEAVTLTSNNGIYDIARCTLERYPPATSAVIIASQISTRSIEINHAGRFFVVVGKLETSNLPVLALSQNNASKLIIPKSHLVATHALINHTEELIRITLEVCLSDYIIDHFTSSGHLLVHEPSLSLAHILNAEAREAGLEVYFTTNHREKVRSDLEFIYLHHLEPGHRLAHSLPSNITSFVDAENMADRGAFGSRIIEQLSPNCQRIFLGIFSGNFATIGSANKSPLTHVLDRSLRYYQKLSHLSESTKELSIETAIGAVVNEDIFQTIDWTRLDKALVRMFPLEDEVTFKGDKTYFLVGLTGELGQSLCHWMIKRGARHIVLTSRKPNVAKAWIKHMASYNANVVTIAMDVTDKESTFEAVQKVRATFPPIAGVANGAMVLNDGLFNVITHEEFNATLRPKVTGTTFLDQLFSKPDLDFFIVFSSLAYVTGNFGQTSYAAANGYMTSVVEGRRKRGLVGSVMHLAGKSTLFLNAAFSNSS